MKRFILKVILFSVFLPNIFAARQDGGTVIGSVMDSTGNPLAFATVYLTRQGGEIVTGDATDESGRFSLKAPRGEYTLTASLIGYKDGTRSISLASGTVDLGVISLEEDTGMLEGATIEAVMPKTKLTGEGLQTNVRGSILENVGNANDVLAKTPGIISKDSGIEVIGKGSPLVYINGRKVTDSSELERLQSNEIQSVEVITNPGAQYDATVRSVVRIRTIRRQGDGFGFNFNASDSQSPRWYQNNDPNAGLNVNYRTGGVDLFGGVNYSRNSFRQESDIDKTSFGKDFLIRDTGSLTNEYHGNTVYGNAGVNWQLADNHFLGGKVEWGRHLTYDVTAFYNALSDLIYYDKSAPLSGLPAYMNAGSVKLIGLENAIYYNSPGLRAHMNCSYVQVVEADKYHTSGKDIHLTPSLTINTVGAKKIFADKDGKQSLWANVKMSYWSKQLMRASSYLDGTEFTDTEYEIKPSFIVDMSLEYRIRQLTLKLLSKNLFNTSYTRGTTYNIDIPQLGRSISLEARIHL